jgi:hypothetical protein
VQVSRGDWSSRCVGLSLDEGVRDVLEKYQAEDDVLEFPTTLRKLSRLQTRREGQAVPLPAVAGVTVDSETG